MALKSMEESLQRADDNCLAREKMAQVSILFCLLLYGFSDMFLFLPPVKVT